MTGGFTLGPGLTQAPRATTYQRKRGEPTTRPLRIYTLDPTVSRFDAGIVVAGVPFEPVEPGPVGSVFEVSNVNRETGTEYHKVDLNSPTLLIEQGREPSVTDPCFHQQMAYAVCSQTYAIFKSALGRDLSWGFADRGRDRLRIVPHAFKGRNAYYDKTAGELKFGYFEAVERSQGRNLPGGFVFTCLSHDIVVHEVSHALLDGLRAHFTIPTGPDVLAFHEGFADLVSIFQRFTHGEVVESAIRRWRGDIAQASPLTYVGVQFAQATGMGNQLRSAVSLDEDIKVYDHNLPAHELGNILVNAVFEAFVTVFERKTARYVRLASGGTGILPDGALPHDLVSLLADEASRLACQFLKVIIRAVDYCPPVDMELGDYLRALVTADSDLVPNDTFGYRDALIDAFRKRKIYPRYVPTLSEAELCWKHPDSIKEPIAGLSFAELRFDEDPGRPASREELIRQGNALGGFLTKSHLYHEFGISPPGDSTAPPQIESVRSLRRIGPDGQISFELVAEVSQQTVITCPHTGRRLNFLGGATLIVDPNGVPRYIIRKRVDNKERQQRQLDLLNGQFGRRHWTVTEKSWAPERDNFMAVHRVREAPDEESEGKYEEFIHISELWRKRVSENYERAEAILRFINNKTLLSLDQNSGEDQLTYLLDKVDRIHNPGFSLYVEGPGGPTGWKASSKFGRSELYRIVCRAEKYCSSKPTAHDDLDFVKSGRLSDDLDDYEDFTKGELDDMPWMQEWNRSGWVEYFKTETLAELRGEKAFKGELKRQFCGTEIDNLYRHLNATGKSTERFLLDLEEWIGPARDIQLVLKNVSDSNIEDIESYVEKRGRGLLSNFHIYELEDEDDDPPSDIVDRLEKLGTKTVESPDTHDYYAVSFEGLRRML